ncbi:MAG: response regulator, partial [Opitutaceae bacterium]
MAAPITPNEPGLGTVELAPGPADGSFYSVLESRSILLVDDEEPVRDVIRAALERAGHKVETVSDGLGASRCLERQPYDLLITDLLMP